jgi:hypothetical protein
MRFRGFQHYYKMEKAKLNKAMGVQIILIPNEQAKESKRVNVSSSFGEGMVSTIMN